jgi:hypothetical protein
MAGMAEQDQIARGRASMGVGSGVGRVVVGAEIGFRFHDTSGQNAGVCLEDQELAQEAGSNNVGASLKK